MNVNESRTNKAPVFTEGINTIRFIAENTVANSDIGKPVAASDDDNDPLSYELGGTDASSFGIVPDTGQLKTLVPLNFEGKSVYAVVVSVSDNNLTDSINVRINVTDVNDSPVFADGTDTTRSIREHAGSGVNIGQPVSATDDDDSNLTYLLNGTDHAEFSIDSSSGQLRTKEPLNFETKRLYAVIVTATDNRGGTTSIDVEIRISNENDVPVFTETGSVSRTIPENTAANVNIGNPVTARDEDRNNLIYSLGGVDALSFAIDGSNGQIKTKDNLDHETKPLYAVVVSVNDSNGGIARISVAITVSDVNDAPTFSEGDNTTRRIAENTLTDNNIGSPITATDQDDDNLTYSLVGTDASSFDIETDNGQLKTESPLDFEDKDTYSVIVSVTDNRGGSDNIVVNIEIIDVNENGGNNAPNFTDGPTTTRSIAENTIADSDIGTPVAATDADDDPLTYSLGGTDVSSFDIETDNGQLKTRSPLNFEDKDTYTVSVSVTDNRGGNDSIDVTIIITDVNDAPTFIEGTSASRSVAENTATNQDIGTPVTATDQDDVNLTYSLGGTDAASFDIDTDNGQLKTKLALDFDDKPIHSVIVSVTDNRGGSDSIAVRVEVTEVIVGNSAPTFTDGTATDRRIAENSVADVNIGTPVAATDADDDPRTYSLGGTDVNSFAIDDSTGQIKTKDPLDFEVKSRYSVTVSVDDNRGGTDSIDVTIIIIDVNEAPKFDDVGGSTARSIAENSVPDTDIGSPISATDPENDNLTYTLSGTDANSFAIDDSTGQLKTNSSLDFEQKQSYSVIVSVTDNVNASVSITVTINVIDVEPEMSIISGRTQQVIDAIIDAIPSVTTADAVTTAHLAAITTLDLQSKGIATLQATDFDGLTSLETLNIQHNSFETFVEGIFEELSSLTTLDLSVNRISSLPESFFDDLTTLTDLSLAGNLLESLPSGIFIHLTSLISLDLSGNDFESLDSGIFDTLTSLEELDLSHNELEELASDIFAELTSLTSLRLNSNKFPLLPSSIFDSFASLTYLDISVNPITALPSDIFDELSSLTTLGMSSLAFTTLVSDIFEGLSSLLTLNLSDNGLTGLPGTASDIVSLTSLDLSSNPLSLTVGMFDDLTSLKQLILSDIGISGIPTGFFDSLTQLAALDLSHNPITSLSGSPFSALSSLVYLNLFGNQLSSVPDGLFVGLSILTSLDLGKETLPLLSIEPVLEKVAEGQFKVILSTGAPFDMTINVSIRNGRIPGFRNYVRIPIGTTESNVRTVERFGINQTLAVSISISDIEGFNDSQSGYDVTVNNTSLELLPAVGNAPVRIVGKPVETKVLVNYPNPFNPETWLPFQLAEPADVSFIIYNLKGEVVRELSLGHLSVGYYKRRSRAAYWDGMNSVGERVSAGIYFCRFTAGDFSALRKMLIVK